MNSNNLYSINIGFNSGPTKTGDQAISIGTGSGASGQNTGAIAIGYQSGNTAQGTNAIAVGIQAGYSAQSSGAVAIGYQAGGTNQGLNSVAIGSGAGCSNQGQNSVAIGTGSGASGQNTGAISIGYQSGNTAQGTNAIAVGIQAGYSAQSSGAVAIGYQAGGTNQALNSVAIGSGAGYSNQRQNSVAIGNQAGGYNQGQYSVAIGYNAGITAQSDRTIVINASGSQINPSVTDGCFINPVTIRTGVTASGSGYGMYYNAFTKELVANNVRMYAFSLSSSAYTPGANTNLKFIFGAITPPPTYVGSQSFYAKFTIQISTPQNNSNNGGFRRFELYYFDIYGTGGGIANTFNDYTASQITVGWSALSTSVSGTTLTVNSGYTSTLTSPIITTVNIEMYICNAGPTAVSIQDVTGTYPLQRIIYPF